ncbi:hypothetical protein AGMMS50256_30730 [Betaproteobacteria bacterium]|nr:hypothetical protein AGMMS50256_30730 [Betaproteobacteria bacterium]
MTETPDNKVVIAPFSDFTQLTAAIFGVCKGKASYLDKQSLLNALERYCKRMAVVDAEERNKPAGASRSPHAGSYAKPRPETR